MRAAEGATDRAAAWVYSGLWRVLVDWFRVPGEPPTLPVGPGEEPDAFKPDPGFVRYLKLWFWIVCLAMDIPILVLWLALAASKWWLALLLLPIALFVAVVPDIVAYVAIHLRWDTTWYVMTERSLRIRRGIWVIHEMTITFENVQNVKVQQGPVERFFGISNLLVESAGGAGDPSGKGRPATGHRGVIEGVADPQRLRDRILARLRGSRTAGLGDEDDQHGETRGDAGRTREHLALLREILGEARLLRGQGAG